MKSHYTLSMVILLILMLSVVTTTQAAFIRTPTSVNATLGSTATFTCSSIRGVIGWLVNGHLAGLNTPSIKASSVGDTSTLRIPATEEYNNTNVLCFVYIREEGVNDSDPVVLQVQGKPAAVSNLTSANLIDVICLTWEAPFTLDITGVDPDISYNISVVVVADSNDSTSLTGNFSVDTPEFNFTMDYPDTSTSVIYEFRVIPWNGAGEGPTSAPVSGFFSGPPASITEDMVEVNVSVNPLDVKFTISYIGDIPPGEMPDKLRVHAFTIDDNQNYTNCSVTIPFILNSNGMVFIHLKESTCLPRLARHRKYKAKIAALNDLGATNSTGEKEFSTHEVQNVTANNCSRPGVVNVSCIFAENSRAMGYLSILCPSDNSSQEEIFVVADKRDAVSTDLNIHAGLNISVPGVPPGDYMIAAFDLESSGLPELSTATNPYTRSAGGDNTTVIEPGYEDDNTTVRVNGTLMEVPKPAMNTELQLCIIFESNSSSDQIVVLAHHTEDPTKLSAYSSRVNKCFNAPTAGNYSFAVFIRKSDNTLEAPATSPEIWFSSVNISSPVPSPSSTPTTSMTDPVPSLLGAIIAVMIIVVAIVVVGITALITVAVIKKNKKYRIHHIEEGCERKNLGHSTSLHEAAVMEQRSFLLHKNSSEELSLNCYQSAENRENQHLRIVADGDETETAGQIPVRKSPTYAAVEPIKPTCSEPPTDLTVKYSSIDQQQTAKLQTGGPVYADVNALPGKTKPPARDDRVQYSAILPQPLVTAPNVDSTPPPLPAKGHVTSNPPPSPRCSLNLENLFNELHSMNPKWQKFGELLGMDEDLLDEIYTNHVMDEECLRDMLGMWFNKSENPTWRAVTDTLRKIGEGQLAESLYLKCTLPGMVETMPQRASPEPAATSAVTHTQNEGVKQLNSSDPSHCAKDSSPDEAQATSHEKENASAAQKDPEEAHSDSESSTYADAIDGETTHPSVEETENKGGEYHGKLHSLRIDSADSGIEEAKQEEGESEIHVSDKLVSRRTEDEAVLQSQGEQLLSKSACREFRGCTEEISTNDEVKVTQESIEDLLTGQAISETSVVDKNMCTLVVGLHTYSSAVSRIPTTAIGCAWSTEPPIRPVLDTESNQSSAVPTPQSNESQSIPVETVYQLDLYCWGSAAWPVSVISSFIGYELRRWYLHGFLELSYKAVAAIGNVVKIVVEMATLSMFTTSMNKKCKTK